jgi:hypothetical protein
VSPGQTPAGSVTVVHFYFTWECLPYVEDRVYTCDEGMYTAYK